jgi:hypothetical protein
MNEARSNCEQKLGATLAVARKLAAYLLAADKSDQPFKPRVAGMPRP